MCFFLHINHPLRVRLQKSNVHLVYDFISDDVRAENKKIEKSYVRQMKKVRLENRFLGGGWGIEFFALEVKNLCQRRTKSAEFDEYPLWHNNHGGISRDSRKTTLL